MIFRAFGEPTGRHEAKTAPCLVQRPAAIDQLNARQRLAGVILTLARSLAT
jgi:hypothetical protein